MDKDKIEQMPERIAQRLQKVNTMFLEKIGQRIKEIGEMSATDAHRLNIMQWAGGDVNDIEMELSALSGKNLAEIEEIFRKTAEYNEKFASGFMGGDLPDTARASLNQYVSALTIQAASDYTNMTRNTAFMTMRNGKKVTTSLHQLYSDVLDDAVTAVTMGHTDFYGAMRQTLRDLADSGIRTKYSPLKGSAGKAADYATGYSRRLDTAVRQNLLWGVKQCNLGMQEQIGAEFGADGWEIDYHANPRPSHAWMGGRQFVAGDKGITVGGRYYPPFSMAEELLSEYGCLHFKWPIICGVSEPNHSPEELRRLKAKDKETFEFEGTEYTGYELTQLQRKIETRIRHAKDRQIIAAAAGDDELRRREQEKINILTHKYKKVCDVSSLPSKKERMSVSGYHRVKTEEEIDPNLTFIKNQNKIKKHSNLPKKINLPDETIKATANVNFPKLQGVVPKGATAEKVYAMAGKDTSTPIRDLPRLYKVYPQAGRPEDWQKKSADVYTDHFKYVVHWYENNGFVPPGEIKTKGLKKR